MASFSASVTEIEHLAPNVVQLTIAIHDGGFRFQPGQWVNLRFPEGVSRAYTIASAPERPQAVQICVRLSSGKGGAALQKLNAGAEVMIEGPHGNFILPKHNGKGVVFLAGDTGIAPVRSIVLHMLAEKDSRAIVVLYEPDRRYILYAADFDPLARSGQIVHVSGAIEGLVDRHRAPILGSIVMAAGFDPFLQRCSAALERIGFDPANVVTESFGSLP